MNKVRLRIKNITNSLERAGLFKRRSFFKDRFKFFQIFHNEICLDISTFRKPDNFFFNMPSKFLKLLVFKNKAHIYNAIHFQKPVNYFAALQIADEFNMPLDPSSSIAMDPNLSVTMNENDSSSASTSRPILNIDNDFISSMVKVNANAKSISSRFKLKADDIKIFRSGPDFKGLGAFKLEAEAERESRTVNGFLDVHDVKMIDNYNYQPWKERFGVPKQLCNFEGKVMHPHSIMWRVRRFLRFKGRKDLYLKYGGSMYEYRKDWWAKHPTYVAPVFMEYHLTRFWQFLSKPFFFWIVYYFNQFFFIYYKVLFALWIRYMFRLVNSVNFVSLYGFKFIKKHSTFFLGFLPIEQTLISNYAIRKQIYYFNLLFSFFRFAEKNTYHIPCDFFWHFKRYKFRLRRRIFRRRYKFIYSYFPALRAHFSYTYRISGWAKVLRRIKFKALLRNIKKLKNTLV